MHNLSNQLQYHAPHTLLNFEAVFRTSGAQPLFVGGSHFGHGRFDLTFNEFGLALLFLFANLSGKKIQLCIMIVYTT